jgi:hypothetical protein
MVPLAGFHVPSGYLTTEQPTRSGMGVARIRGSARFLKTHWKKWLLPYLKMADR